MRQFLLVILLLLTSVGSWAHSFEVDGIYYQILSSEQRTISVTHCFDSKVKYSGDVVIPESVIFYGVSNDDGVYYDGVTFNIISIENDAFNDCSGLTSVSIPNSVTKIADWAFEGCIGLTSITIPDSVTEIGVYAFSNCSALTSVSIGHGVTSIGERAFFGCSALTSIVLPNSVTEIGEGAFWECSSLSSIAIPGSVTSIGEDAFYCCGSLEHIVVAADNPVYDSRENCNAIIETSSNLLMFGCKNTVIPNSVTAIGDGAFHGCIGLISITIPNSVTMIDANAFSRCYNLTSITIPDSVTEIGGGAFNECESLTSIVIPNGVTEIEAMTFYCCSALTSVTIPNSVARISYGAFSGCEALPSIVIPNSVTRIDGNAFSVCYALKDVYCLAESVPFADWVAFDYGMLPSATLHVPAASLEAYRTTEPWSDFGQIVAIGGGDGIEGQASEAFTNPTVYDLGGRRTAEMRKGINLLRSAGGRVKKVLRK